MYDLSQYDCCDILYFVQDLTEFRINEYERKCNSYFTYRHNCHSVKLSVTTFNGYFCQLLKAVAGSK